VWHDILGLYEDHVPRHTKRFRTLGAEIRAALEEFDSDVRQRRFPTDANSARMDDDVLRAALQLPG
jgi:3-methyl-2-oxobutanoate hydroxymethyltransferase